MEEIMNAIVGAVVDGLEEILVLAEIDHRIDFAMFDLPVDHMSRKRTVRIGLENVSIAVARRMGVA